MRILSAGILILTLLIFVSCSEDKKYVIPERKMVPLLVDIHIADEIGTSRYELDPELELDSASVYGWVFRKHGITKAEFDSSMSYYAGKPDNLNDIYGKVIASLSKMEVELAKAEREESQKTVIYKDDALYRLPAEGNINKIPFDVKLTGPGDYKLDARILIQRDDQSVNPHVGLFLSNTDTAGIEKRNYLSTLPYIKDGQPHTYNIRLIPDLPPPVRLKGWFINQEEMAPYKEKHFRVEDIILSYSVIK